MQQYYLVMPADLNHIGTMFGGVAMNLADKYGAICGSLVFPKATFVTRHFDIFNFLSPAHLGDILEISTQLLSTGNTSITIGIEAINVKTKSKIFATKAVYVNVHNGKKSPIPKPTVSEPNILGTRKKNYYVEGSGWFVVRATNKRQARSIGVAEYGRGNVHSVRLATEVEVKTYLMLRSSERKSVKIRNP